MKTQERIKKTAEIFTPSWLVEEMLDRLPQEIWKNDGKTFLDNSCGNGNFIVAAFIRKLKNGHNSLIALKTLFGADIMKDNIQECRHRLLEIVGEPTKEHCRIVLKNIKWLDTKKYPRGSLDYDFNFADEPTEKQIIALLNTYYKSKKAA